MQIVCFRQFANVSVLVCKVGRANCWEAKVVQIQVLVIPWFVRMYDAIMHERERVHYRTYMHRTMV